MAERRTRARKFKFDDKELVERALKFLQDDEDSRTHEMDARLQRYAKFRQWTDEGISLPFDDASNASLPDLTTASLRTQDTLFNAALRTRPTMTSKAVDKKDRQKQELVDITIDYQVYVENGYTWLADAADAFVNDGHFTLFIPWVEEKDKIVERREAPPVPDEELPARYFLRLMADAFPDAQNISPKDPDPTDSWDWEVTDKDGNTMDVSFYTAKKRDVPVVEMDVTRIVPSFQGPALIAMDREDVLHPVKCANLQPPSPHNPGGASHVMLRDQASVLEIMRLQRSGRYDAITAEDAEGMSAKAGSADSSEQPEKAQRDIIAGNTTDGNKGPDEHEMITRLMVFDRMELDTDGFPEEVVYWVAAESKKLLRKPRRLTEEFPASRVRRPFAEESFIPVRGRRTGIGLLEIGEGVHDTYKQILDQAIDLGTFSMIPPGFYRPTSTMRDETIRYNPGELYPLADPKNDIHYPVVPNQGHAQAVNLMTLLDQWSQRSTMVGDLQLGRVPHGKASALRTSSGMAMVAGEGDARPERLLHRFFNGLAQAWTIIHDYNKRLLPMGKKIRIALPNSDHEDPYREVNRNDFDGVFEFEFRANVFNTSRLALQQTLTELAQFYISQIAFLTGVADGGTVYQLFKKITEAYGQDPDELGLRSPAGVPLISFEDALAAIMDDQMPRGAPAEGPPVHLQKLTDFATQDEFGLLSESQVQIFGTWMQVVEGMMQQMMQQQAMAQAASNSQTRGRGEGGGQEAVRSAEPPVQPNELLDESLPSAGGGANTQ